MSFSISIIVCTHNGANRISNCISSLVHQKNPPGYEILVVDNASKDGTGDLVRSHLGSSFPNDRWRLIDEEKPGLLYARLAGLREARYEWVLFCDDDNILFPDFLFQCQQVLSENSRIGVLGSHGIPEFIGQKPNWFDQYSSSYAVGPQLGGNVEGKQLVYVYGACSIYRKKPLLNLFKKGFIPGLSGRKGKEMSAGDDVELCWLMQLLGYKVAYSHKLQFIHQLPASRLNWEYYIRLKRGISAGAGLLSAYTYFSIASYRSFLGYVVNYSLKTIKTALLYLKYRIRWGSSPSRPKDHLSLAILESQMDSYFKHSRQAFSHFRQLKRYFGS